MYCGIPGLALWLALGLLAGCGGGDEPPPPRERTPLDMTTTGTITGEVRYEGDVPTMATVNFGSFRQCFSQHTGPVPRGDALVQNGRVENAFVYVKEGLEERVFLIPTEPVTIDQRGCLYVPHVAGAQVGQAIRFVNSDPTLHNVHGRPAGSSAWNVSLARKGANRTVRVGVPEVGVSVRCDLHPWMQGWLGVVDHPYFAVTGADGHFTLPNVPPGDYVVAVWHERFGTRESRVSLVPTGTATVDFTLTGQ